MLIERASYASIEQKRHPAAQSQEFDFQERQLDGESNSPLVVELISELKDKVLSNIDGTGEWEWLQKKRQNNFIDAVHKAEVEVVSNYLTNMFKTEATYGYLSPSFSDALKNLDKTKSDILCNIDSCLEFSDLTDVKKLGTLHGNPYGVKIEGITILPDTPRHFYYSYNISRFLSGLLSPVVLEIGGGYGGLCLQNWKRFEGQCTLVNIDLMPGIASSYFYLRKHGVPVNLILDKKNEIKLNEVNLVLASSVNFLTEIIPTCNLIFNSRSLCEMHPETINEYFSYMNNSGADFIYHENSNFLLFPDSERHVEVLADQFPIDEKKYRLQYKCITPFTGGDGRYREYLYSIK